MKLHRYVPLLVGLAAVTLAAGCGSTSSTPTQSSSSSTAPPAATSAPATSAPATPTPTAAASGSLTGAWSGNYTGAFSGSFTLNWTELGSSLSGNIDLSSIGTETITGTVSGSTLNFGAVGSEAITYTGTVSGSSMSGSYTVQGAGGGNWTASQTS